MKLIEHIQFALKKLDDGAGYDATGDVEELLTYLKYSLSGGVGLIAEERERQIAQEKWTAEHDDTHTNRELARAAICYASASAEGEGPVEGWPWHRDWFKPSGDLVRNLTKAGALIAAEIDRLQRQQPTPQP